MTTYGHVFRRLVIIGVCMVMVKAIERPIREKCTTIIHHRIVLASGETIGRVWLQHVQGVVAFCYLVYFVKASVMLVSVAQCVKQTPY